jgi:hypothetical protein
MKVRKKFEYDGVELRIVEREETYMNRKSTVTRVLTPNGGVIPVKIQRRQTLKSMVEETIKTLDNFKSIGADVKAELLKRITVDE